MMAAFQTVLGLGTGRAPTPYRRIRGGHALHTAFASKILEETDAWRIVESPVDPAVAGLPVAVPVKSARLAN